MCWLPLSASTTASFPQLLVSSIPTCKTSSGSKTKSWIAGSTMILVVAENSYASFCCPSCKKGRWIQIGPFHVAVVLKRGSGNQGFPSVASDIGWSVVAVSYQGIQWRGFVRSFNSDPVRSALWLHPKAQMIEWSAPVTWQFCFDFVKSSESSIWIVDFLVKPVIRIIVKRHLQSKSRQVFHIYIYTNGNRTWITLT